MHEQKPQITFLGGVGSVTGAHFLLSVAGTQILVDCGLLQSEEWWNDFNRQPFPYNPAEMPTLIITHAHLDHVGRIPKLVREGFRGVIYSTLETKLLAKLILENALGIMENDIREHHREALYTSADIAMAFSLWKTAPYHASVKLTDAVSFVFRDSGHILGSAIAEITANGKNFVFTGDLGNSPSPLMQNTEFTPDADYMVIESVYGDRVHESKEERQEKLETAIEQAIGRKGVLMIPTFSLERAQVLLYEMNTLVEKKHLPVVPVFLDSPLAIAITDIYRNAENDLNAGVQETRRHDKDIFSFPGLTMTPTVTESNKIVDAPNPKIIIAGSGMSHGGRILMHEKRYLPDPHATLLMIGYQAPGTIGRQLQDGAKTVEIYGEQVPVRAHIETISGYSAHRDRDGLVAFVQASSHRVKRVFAVMGEPQSSLFLVQRLRDYLGVNAVYPTLGETVTLD